jgi:hypothetical protein
MLRNGEGSEEYAKEYSGDGKPDKKAAATVQQTSDAIVAVNTTQVQVQNSQKLELMAGVRRISCNFLRSLSSKM